VPIAIRSQVWPRLIARSTATRAFLYVEKRNQYEWRGIPEYWIVDPSLSQVTVLSLTAAEYEAAVFCGEETIQSPTLPNLEVTAASILSVK
jgi:Uma2 family endonuclease